jgi:methylated-DNA-[protein]-cysteine S-methyltransferase
MSFVAVQQTNKKIIKRTPFGSVCIVWSVLNKFPRIIRVLLSRKNLVSEALALRLFPDAVRSSCAEIDAVADSIKAFLEGEPVTFPLNRIDLSPFSKFQQSVLRAQYAIPRGRVSTYGLIAQSVGAPGAGRAVGNVMAANPFPLIIPCHRTILSDLRLGGFQCGVKMKKLLLEKEGILLNEAGKVIGTALYYAPK